MVSELLSIGVTPNVPQKRALSVGTVDRATDDRITCHEDYAESINARFGIETMDASITQRGFLRRFKVRDTDKVRAMFSLHLIGCNLIQLCNLLKSAIVVV